MSQTPSLNPGASEFVPTFSMPNMSNLSLNDNSQQQQAEEQQSYQPLVQENTRYQNNHHNHNNYHHHQQQNYYHQQQHQQQQHQQQHQQQRLYGQNNNTSHRHSYNPNYRGNNYRPNYRRENHHNYNNNYNNHHNNYNQGYHQQQQQSGDVDSFELEARCDAVIEILQDDKIRDQLNPQAQQDGGQSVEGVHADEGNDADVNEDELEEMMAMQEECRLEMMKFYIQSQNPALFEEIYHDVSYPDAAAAKTKVPEDELLSPKTYPKTDETKTNTTESTENTSSAAALKLTDMIINELNPECAEFVPNKFVGEESNTA